MTPTGAHDQAETLKAGLEKERAIYEHLLETTRQQHEVLLGGRTDEILELARTKEKELGRIEEIESELAPLKERWPALKSELDGSLRNDIDRALAALEDVLKRLIDLEVSGQRNVERLREETNLKLRQVDGGRRIQKAYARGETPPRYVDRSR